MVDDDYFTGGRITRAVDLPEWFDTEKYASAVRLDARGWEEQLEIRSFCHEQIWQQSLNEDIDLAATTDYLGFRLDELLAAIRETPIYPFYTSAFHDGYSGKFGKLPHRPKRSIAPGLSALTPANLADLVSTLPTEKQRKLIQILSSSLNGVPSPSDSESDWLSEPIKACVSNTIEVNRYLPNKLLLQSFEHYLMSSGEELDSFKGRPIRSNTFSEWCNCGLLQYIDLVTWSLEAATAITNKAHATGIFPNSPEKGEENIRTTTEKHATSILHDNVVMHTLRAYAHWEEISEST